MSILISFSHICLGLLSAFFPSGFLSGILYVFLISCVSSSYSVHLILDLITIITFGEEYSYEVSHSVIFSMLLLLLMPTYFPHHPIFKCPQCVNFCLGERPSFTSMQNKSQNYSLVYLIIRFYDRRWEDEILSQLVANISKYLNFVTF